MGIRTAIKPLGSRKGRYKKGTVLCNLSNGQSATITLYPGIYYIRGQGAGGWGNASGWGDGYGGGSGAGFEGFIRITKKMQATVRAGVCPDSRGNGEDTVISDVITLGGGRIGVIGSAGDPQNGGILSLGNCKVKSYTVMSNGNGGIIRGGGNSVLTNSGGGPSNADATAPGAGGGGSYGFYGGGKGYYGEILIRYESL